MGRQRDILADRELIRSWASEENGEKLILDDEYDVLIQALVRLSHKDRVWLASMAQSVPSWLQRQIDNCIENVQHVEKVRELMDLEKEWKNAYVQRDLVALDRIEAVDFILTDSLRNTLEKAQDIEEVKSGVYTVTSFVMDKLKVRILGDVAIVTGRIKQKALHKEKDASGLLRFTDTWIKRAGRWQCVAAHSSEIAQK